ncbi:MAG: M13-type metalloendopeptidase [Pseudomonadota bacterium]|jgi:putative endopeptidase|nr:MAG: peptidase [Pseudomonadota bacterium]
MSRFAPRAPIAPVAAAVLLAIAGCRNAPGDAAAAAAGGYLLDESQLIQPIRFHASDLDPEVSACVDFGAHTNGKWLAANPIPPDQTSWGAFNVLAERSLQVRKQIAEQVAARANPAGIEKIVADFWVTGMDEAKLDAAGITPLASRLAEIEALTDGASVAAHLRTVAARGENPLFGFEPESDFEDSAMVIAYASQGGTSLPDRSYYFDDDKKDIREAFVKHVARMLELSGVPAEEAARQAGVVMAMETRLARASKSQEELSRDVSLYYNPVTLAEADALTPNFPWSVFFDSQGVAAPAKFSLAIPDFHREVDRMLAEVPVQDWKAYLRFRLVDAAAPYLGRQFTDAAFDFYGRILQGMEEQRPRWKRVLAALEDGAGEAMGQLYVQVAFPPESRARMEALVSNLTAALKERIEKLDWMGAETRARALEKWNAFTAKIGYPEKWRDWSGLATSRESYFANAAAAAEFNYRWQLSKIGKPVDRTEWGMTPQTVNAYYHPLLNEIVFPAAILQPPFFDPEADDAVNYAAIGGVIGHELTHGYDDQGSRFGPSGNFEEWWSEEDARRFKALTGRLVQQYSAYEVDGMKVNGNLTLGENIADLGGLSIAYDALQKASAGKEDPMIDGLTRDQRFFHGWAAMWRTQYRPEALKVRLVSDPHAPGHVRAWAPLTNHPAFAPAFGCKDTDPMVNAGGKRVVIW